MTRAERLIQDGFMNVQDARAFLAISKSSMYRLLDSKTISHAIFHGRIVIPVKALHEYAASRITLGNVA